jgi:PAS domain S-box-containing protein
MFTKNHRFESEVHLGLLAIVFLLLFVNFFSNAIIYKARTFSREETLARLRSAAVAASRVAQANFPQDMPTEQVEVLKRQFKLKSITTVPSRPSDDSPEARRRWFASIAHVLPADHLAELADKLLKSQFSEAHKGTGDEYFLVYPIPAGAGRHLIVVSMDGSSVMILRIGLATLLLLSVAYLLVSRFIFSPFRKIRESARKAGRTVDSGSGDVMTVVADYQKIIDELRENESKLLKLNEEINRRAGSLERFNEYLLTSISSGIITLGRDGKVLSINRAASSILDIEPGDAEEVTYRNLFPAESEPSRRVEEAISAGRTSGYEELVSETADGGRMTLGLAISTVRDDEGDRVGYSILLNDLTEIDRLREELETKHRLAAMGEMAGGLAHQLRNSLGAMMGYGRLALKKSSGIGSPVESIESLLTEAGQAEALIQQFLDFTRPFAFSPVPTLLGELLDEIVESFAVRPEYRNIRFEVVKAHEARIDVDPLLLKQAIANLVTNAADAYPDRTGVVWVTLDKAEAGCRIMVRDEGCGISAADRERIFTPFFSLKPSGTGLGLPLAGKIVNLHGGRISVESRERQGTTFTVILPVDRARHKSRQAEAVVS